MTVSIGVLSTAHPHADAYAELLAEFEDVELAGVADERGKRGRDAADRYGADFFPDPDRLLDGIDGALVCSTNARHGEWIARAFDADVDVLSEKPLAPTVDEASAIVDRWRGSPNRLGVAMPLRFSEPVERAETALANGEIGAIRSISGTNRGRMPGGWFVDPDEAGGGAATDHTVHVVDLVSHLTDERIAEVYAEVGTRFHDIDVEDVNVLSMRLADGTDFLLDGSWSKPDAWRTWGDATIEFVGESGTIAVDCFDQSLVHARASGDDEGVHSVPYGTGPNAGLLRDFVASVREDRAPAVAPTAALEAVAVVEAAYESARTGAPIEVPYRAD